MSTQVFPSLLGQGWSVKRTPIWSTRKQESISGKRTFIADWSYPRWRWELVFEFLRQAGANQQAATFAGSTYAEFAQLAGFFNARQGGFDSFLYTDPDDNTVAGQSLGSGDGTTTAFQLVRAFGGFVEPVLAPNTVGAVYLGGVSQPGADWSVAGWGTATPGVVTFTTAPGLGVAVTADFSFSFPCSFKDDSIDFEKFMAALYAAKSVAFESIK